MNELTHKLATMKTEHIYALHRIAKSKDKGVRPFFRHPKDMMSLRREKELRDRGVIVR